MSPSSDPTRYAPTKRLWAGCVSEINGTSLTMLLDDGRSVNAQHALFVPYRVRLNDTLLVLGAPPGDCYAIGVLRGRGRLALQAEGGLTMRAHGSVLQLHGDRGVQINGETVALRARDRLVRAASRSLATVERLQSRIRGQWYQHSGDKDELVRGDWRSSARQIHWSVTEAIRFNGSAVNIG